MIYVISSKDVYSAKRLKSVASSMNQVLRVLDLKDLVSINFKLHARKGDVLYIRNPYLNGKADYLPKIIKLAKRFKAQGGRVVDANVTKGDLGKGKWRDYQKLKKAGLPIPKTKMLVENEQWSVFRKQKKNLSTNHSPLATSFVSKWIYGMKAKGTFLISSPSDLIRIPKYIPRDELMAQEYIKAEYEYKIITVGYKALPVVLKFKFNKKFGRMEFASYSVIPIDPNVLEGERRNPLSIVSSISYLVSKYKESLHFGRDDKSRKLINLAQRAAKTLGRELAKIDILEKDGKFYILEVNRFPGLKSFERLTNYNVFKAFLRYLISLQSV